MDSALELGLCSTIEGKKSRQFISVEQEDMRVGVHGECRFMDSEGMIKGNGLGFWHL